MEQKSEIVKTKLANGNVVYIQVTPIKGEEEVAFDLPSFSEVTETIKGIAESVLASLKEIKPKKASVEFGLEVALESGKLTTLLVKGSSTANLKITLEWGE